MKKITLWILALFGWFQMNAQQLWEIESCLDLTSSTYGPMYSVATANATNRMAIVYPASQLTGILGQNLSAMYFERGGTSAMLGTPNFKIYLKEVAAQDFGAGALDWATATTGAVLVYDSNPAASVGTSAGWKAFPFTTNFIYSGLQNLAVFFEYSNSTASNSIAWSYEFTSPCIDTSNDNTGKYTNVTTGVLPTSLATSNYRRPLIGFDYVVTCPKPTGLIVSGLTSSSGNITWTAGGAETQWEYAVVPAGSGVPTTATTVSSNILTNVPLNSGTSYQVYVKAICGVDDESGWTVSESFTTPCIDAINFFENFDTYAAGTTTPMPNCWSKFGNGTAYVSTGGVLPGSPPNRLYLFANSSATTPTSIRAILPSVSNLQANTHRLKFKAYASTANKTFEVGYQTDVLDPSTFVLLETINLPGTTAATAQEFTVTPSGIPAGVKNLVFNNPGTGSVGMYIDDVIWETIPSCPDVANLNFSSITDTQVVINWTAGGTETEWQYVYGATTVTDPSTLTAVDVMNTPTQTVAGLTESTSYRIWVRSKCNATDFGAWIGPLTIATLCAPVAAFSENFDTSLTGSANPMTLCWDRAGSGSTYITTGAVQPLSAPNRIYMFASGTTPTQAYTIMPPVNNLQAATHRLRFKAYATAADKTLEVGYLGSASDLSTFTQIEQVTQIPSTAATAQEYVIEPTDIPVGINRLVFRLAPTVSSTTMYIDDVFWEVIPSCPDVSSLTAGNAFSTSVAISWLPGGSETAWQYVYGATTVEDPSTLTINNVSDNTETTISGLAPGTSYKVWVRSNCGSDTLGVWSDPITITTTCSPVVAFSENFDSSSTGTTAAMPNCWTKFGTTGSVYPQTGGVAPGTPPNRLYMYSSATARAFAVMPPVSNLQAETHRLKFKAYATTANKTIELGYFENSNDAESFVPLETFNLPSTTAATATEFFIEPTGISAGIESLVFRLLGSISGATTLYLDDVTWETIPACFDVISLGIANLTNNTTDLVWAPGSSETSWQYVYGLSSITDPTTLTPVDVTGTPSASIADLTQNTSYKYWVRSNCGNGDLGNWSQPFTFKTICDATTVFSENFDTYATGTTSPMPDCWNRAGTGSTYITTGGVAPGTAPNRLYMTATGSGANPTEAFAILPPVSNLQAETHRLRLKAYATTANKTLEIGFFGDVADLTTFILLQTIDLPSTTAATAQEFILTIDDVPAGVTSLVFRNGGTSSGATTLYIDDVAWEAIPNTPPSCVTPIVTSSTICGNFANVITWTPAEGTAEGYNLTIGTTTGGSDILNNVSIGNVSTYSFSGNANTTYYFTLVPFNISGAATGCVEQSFTTFATGCYCTSIPSSNDASGITNVILGTTSFPNGDVTYFDHSATAVSLPQGVNTNLQITLATGFTYETNVWIDLNDNFTFEPSELLYVGTSTNVNPTVLNASFSMPANAALGTHRMRIVSTDALQTPANPCYNGTFGVTLDFAVIITPAPSCLAPTAIISSNVGSSTASISWTASVSAPANGYEYYVSTTNTTPAADVVVTGSVGAGILTADLTTLTPVTTYYVWLRSVCSGTDFSAWSSSASFTTTCASIVPPHTQDFATAMPSCWSGRNGGTVATGPTGANTTIWVADGFLNVGSTGAIKVNLYSSNRIGWIISPTFDLSATTETYELSFNYGLTTFANTTVSAMGADDSVKVVMSEDNGTTWTEINEFNAASNVSNTNQTFTYPITSTSATVKFALLATDGAVENDEDYDFFVDNFKVESALRTPSIENNTFKAYPNPVKDILNLSYTENITKVEVFNMLGQQVKTTLVNANQTQVDMSNLAAGSYLVRVSAENQVKTIKVIKQ